jgi:hypothetical protein
MVAAMPPIENNTSGGTPLATQKAPSSRWRVVAGLDPRPRLPLP